MALSSFNFGPLGQSPGRRGAARVRLTLPGKVVLISGHHSCRINDLSVSGVCLTLTIIAPPVGQSGVIMVHGIEAFGTVVWRRGHQCGLAFDEPLTIDEVVRLRAINDHFEAIESERRRRQASEFVSGRRV